jgi:hypothetical protein
MFNTMRTRAAVTAVVALAGLSATAGPAAAAGNSVNEKACQNGGWKTLLTSTGGAFKKQGACVSYGAHGGQYQQPVTNCWQSSNPSYPFDLQLLGPINTQYNALVVGTTNGSCDETIGFGQQTLASAPDQTSADAECTAINGTPTVATNAQTFGYLAAPADYWGCGPNF